MEFFQNYTTELNINKVRTITATLSKGDKTNFTNSLRLAAEVEKGLSWWKSEGSALAKEAGLKVDMDTFAKEVYGFQKSYLYKLAKAAALPTDTINAYIAACDEDEANGGRPSRSIEALLKWAKGNETTESEEGESEGEEGGEVEQKPIITFTCRLKDLGLSEKNVSLRISADGSVTTTATPEAIQQAIAILTSALQGSAE